MAFILSVATGVRCMRLTCVFAFTKIWHASDVAPNASHNTGKRTIIMSDVKIAPSHIRFMKVWSQLTDLRKVP